MARKTRDQNPKPPAARKGGRPSVRFKPKALKTALARPAVETPLPPRKDADRIAKVIARAGLGSRREAEEWIEAGRVAVNGAVITSPALNVTARDAITVDGQPLPQRERTRLFLYHKPRGLVTTTADPEGRPTIFDALPENLPRLVSVGRLDLNTEGLLLLTNDGGLARVLELPETGWLRRYRVRAYGETDQATLDGLANGVTIDGMHYGPIEARLERKQGDNVWLTVGLREGKNREVKRILEHLGLKVNRLIRVSFGPFQLGDLGEGAVEEVRTRVLKDQLGEKLAAQAGADFDAPIFAPDTDILDRPEPAGRKPAGLRRAPAREAKETPRPEETKGRSVWRADEDTSGRARPPRRGADPKAERLANAEKERARAGRIADARGRRVLVERIVRATEEPVREAPVPRRRSAAATAGGARGGSAVRAVQKPARRPSGDRPDLRGREGQERPGKRPGKPGGSGPAGRTSGGKPGARPPRSGGPRKPTGPRKR